MIKPACSSLLLPNRTVSGPMKPPCTADIATPIAKNTPAVDASVKSNRAPPNKENVASNPANGNDEKKPMTMKRLTRRLPRTT